MHVTQDGGRLELVFEMSRWAICIDFSHGFVLQSAIRTLFEANRKLNIVMNLSQIERLQKSMYFSSWFLLHHHSDLDFGSTNVLQFMLKDR
jgi:hypothetical protein